MEIHGEKLSALVRKAKEDCCNDEVFERGESVRLISCSKQEATEACREATKSSEYLYDWHYVAGRVHVKRLLKSELKTPWEEQ